MHLALFLANVQDLWSGCRGLPCCYICRCLLCWFLQITALVAIQYLQLPALLIFADHCFSCNTIFAVACSADFCRSLLWLQYSICSCPLCWFLRITAVVAIQYLQFACSVDLCGSLLRQLFFPNSAPSLSHPIRKLGQGCYWVKYNTTQNYGTIWLPQIHHGGTKTATAAKTKATESLGELDAAMSR